MKVEDLIIRRFSELEQKAADIKSLPGSPDDVPFDLVRGWGTSVLSLFQNALGENTSHYQNFRESFNIFGGSRWEFKSLKAVFMAAKEDYEGGYLFNLRSLVKAEVLGDAFEQANELLASGYKDPACVLAGVSLEVSLKDLCSRNNIDHGKMDKMNSDLAKAGVYNVAKQKQITAWADLRNKAAHGDWSDYSHEDVKDFVSGVQRFVADYL